MTDKLFRDIPEFGATSKEAYRILRQQGVTLRQKERVFWAVAALEPVTHARLTKFFEGAEFALLGKGMTHSSVTARAKELIDEGRVRCVGTEKDPQSHMEVELLAVGRDERTHKAQIAPVSRSLPFPNPIEQAALRQANRQGFVEGKIEGMVGGFVFALCMLVLGGIIAEVVGFFR